MLWPRFQRDDRPMFARYKFISNMHFQNSNVVPQHLNHSCVWVFVCGWVSSCSHVCILFRLLNSWVQIKSQHSHSLFLLNDCLEQKSVWMRREYSSQFQQPWQKKNTQETYWDCVENTVELLQQIGDVSVSDLRMTLGSGTVLFSKIWLRCTFSTNV